MPRYCVNATVAVDAWAFVEADDPEDADEKAGALSASDFEAGDALHVDIQWIERDD